MSELTRRKLLAFFGSGVAAAAVGPHLSGKLGAMAQVAPLDVTPIRLPVPLPVYQTNASFLPTGVGGATTNGPSQLLPASADTRLSSYTVVDDVVVPPEYERYVISRWGDRSFSNPADYVGYNADFTAFVPLNNTGNPNQDNQEGYLWINHEYVSYPISAVAPETSSDLAAFPTTDRLVLGIDLSQNNVATRGEFMYNQGGSCLVVRRGANGRYAVVSGDSRNRRIHGLSGLAINAGRTDSFNNRSSSTAPDNIINYRNVTSFGVPNRPGDNNFLVGTGPAATQVFNLSTDGLGNRIIGTAFNCSGGVTPWGTVFSAEENFQGDATFFVGVQEGVLPNGTQTGYIAGTTGADFGMVGEKYGWMVEIDCRNPNTPAKKHTWLGRYRHENIAFRVAVGKKLVAYMGDDRRGGHTWKYVSNGTVTSPNDPSNSVLFESGVLYVARFNPDGTGTWLPLLLSQPTNPIPPSVLASVELAALGRAQQNGRIRLPRRAGVAGQTANGGFFNLDLTNEATALPGYQGRTLADFYTSQGAVLCDAFAAANLIGGTPSSRPEDIEVRPGGEVFVAYTDHIAGGDGYPDSRIFPVSKFNAAVNAQQPSGAIYKIVENSADGTGLSFRWEAFSPSGEAGAVGGTGFANVDNLAFDSNGNIWGVTDMSTSQHNGFTTGANPTQRTIDHTQTGPTANLVGVFGNNFLFFVPTVGPNAGNLVPFAYGPPRCEMTGPTFVGDTLIISVQHPGEDVPIGDGTLLTRTTEILNLDGTLFNQTRTVPRGSNWPSNIEGTGNAPRPTVIGIRRRSGGRFV